MLSAPVNCYHESLPLHEGFKKSLAPVLCAPPGIQSQHLLVGCPALRQGLHSGFFTGTPQSHGGHGLLGDWGHGGQRAHKGSTDGAPYTGDRAVPYATKTGLGRGGEGGAPVRQDLNSAPAGQERRSDPGQLEPVDHQMPLDGYQLPLLGHIPSSTHPHPCHRHPRVVLRGKRPSEPSPLSNTALQRGGGGNEGELSEGVGGTFDRLTPFNTATHQELLDCTPSKAHNCKEKRGGGMQIGG